MAFSLFPSLLLATLAAQGASSPPQDLAITGARIEVGNGTVIENGTVVIHAGQIAAVGAGVSVPSGATVVDAKGLVVYPGFIDAYTTNGLKLPDAPASGSPPSIRDNAPATMWHGNRRGIRGDIEAAKALDVKGRLTDNYAQGITTALISSGSGSVRGIAAVVDYVGNGSVLVPTAAAELSFRGGGGGGTSGGSGYPGTLFGLTATLRQTLADSLYYAAQTNPPKDVVYENLRPLMTGGIPALFAVDTAREIVRATRIADEFNLRLLIGGGREAYRNADLLKKKNIAVLVSVDQGFEPSMKVDNGPNATPKEVLQERHDQWEERNQNIKKLHEAGVPFAFCTSSSSLGDYLKNVRKIVANGLPREAALKALTSGSAEILGVGKQVGTIEPGKKANLVLMTGDFIDEKSEVKTVIVEGEKVDLKGASK